MQAVTNVVVRSQLTLSIYELLSIIQEDYIRVSVDQACERFIHLLNFAVGTDCEIKILVYREQCVHNDRNL